jgi:hypothetical protein
LASQAKILRTYVITFCSQANVITFPYKRDPSSISAGMDYAAPAGVTLEAGSGQPHQQQRPPLHRRIAGDGDHLCTSSDNDLRSERLASSSNHLRVSATVNRSSPPSSYGGGDNEAIKAKESGTQQQVALMVPAAEATTSARAASPAAATTSAPTTAATSAPVDDGCLGAREEVLTPVLPRSEDKPSKNAAATPAAYDVLYGPPVRPVAREKPWMWRTRPRRDRRPCGGRTATPRPSGRRQRRKLLQGHLSQEARNTVADSACSQPAPCSRSSPPLQGR